MLRFVNLNREVVLTDDKVNRTYKNKCNKHNLSFVNLNREVVLTKNKAE